MVTQSFPDPSPTAASLSFLPASYAVTSDAVPAVTPSAVETSAGGSGETTSTSAAAQPTETETGTCKAGTLSSGGL